MIRLEPLRAIPLTSPGPLPPPASASEAASVYQADHLTPLAYPTDRGIDQLTGTRLENATHVGVHIDGEKAFQEMYRLIESATHHIHLETYIFKDDKTSKEMAEALVKKAQQGVQVRLLVDYVGGNKTDERLYQYLKSNGVEVALNNPPKGLLTNLFTFNRRDHRKMLIVDGQTAMTGGMNVADEYRYRWHDVMMSLAGKPVQAMQRHFLDMWGRNGGKVAADPAFFPPSAPGAIPTRVLATDGTENQQIKQALFHAIATAKDNIYVEMAYFADRDLVAKLAEAARRGVKVKVIVPKKSDLPIVDLAARFTFRSLLEAGAEVYLYKGAIMHTKGASVDGKWATIGSANGTNRAFRINQELNLAISDEKVVQTLDQELFQADIARSERVTSHTPGILSRMVSFIADLF